MWLPLLPSGCCPGAVSLSGVCGLPLPLSGCHRPPPVGRTEVSCWTHCKGALPTLISVTSVTTSHCSQVACLAMSGDGCVLASGQTGSCASVRVWDFDSGQCLALFQAHSHSLSSLRCVRHLTTLPFTLKLPLFPSLPPSLPSSLPPSLLFLHSFSPSFLSPPSLKFLSPRQCAVWRR